MKPPEWGDHSPPWARLDAPSFVARSVRAEGPVNAGTGLVRGCREKRRCATRRNSSMAVGGIKMICLFPPVLLVSTK